jgi:PRC-barrel domain protein
MARVNRGKEVTVNLVRLERHQHPRPPHTELRLSRAFDSGGRYVGDIENLYVDDDRELRFVDVVTSGFLGLGKKHHLVPVETITGESPGQITLGVDQQAVEGAPALSNPKAAPDDELQRSTREHYGYG